MEALEGELMKVQHGYQGGWLMQGLIVIEEIGAMIGIAYFIYSLLLYITENVGEEITFSLTNAALANQSADITGKAMDLKFLE